MKHDFTKLDLVETLNLGAGQRDVNVSALDPVCINKFCDDSLKRLAAEPDLSLGLGA